MSSESGSQLLESIAVIDSTKASIYLKKFCRHFSHKLPTEFDDNHGYVAYPSGSCNLTAKDGQLIFKLQSENNELIAKLEDVVARHMERFAFRDEIKVRWQRQTG